MRFRSTVTLIAVASVAAVSLTGLALAGGQAASADAAPSVSIIAGTGTSGYNGDNIAATSAQIGQLNGLTVDPSGNVDILDGINRRVREINSNTGQISTIQGDGSTCSTLTDANQPVTGMCPNLGLAVAPTSAIYYGDNAGITQAVSGTAFHYAGDYTDFNAPHDDGPKFNVEVDPANIAIDPISGNLFYNENHAIREVIDGAVNTVVGNPNDCNPVTPANGQTALGTCYAIGDLAFLNDALYFTDTDASGNDYVCMVKNGVVTVVAGNGTYNDSPTNGPALSTGLSAIRALTVAPDGTIFIAGPSRGRIWEITPSGQLQFVYEFQGGIPFLTSDQQGNVYAALAYTFQVVKLSGYAGGVPPIVTSPTTTAPPVTTPTPTVTPTAPVTPTALNWVALGDSYSSGEGNPPFIAGSNTKTDQCHRSLAAYPEVIAHNNSEYTLSFHACSGALINDFYAPNHSNTGETHSQLDWVNAKTNIVTLTIGGNDAKFVDVMTYCAQRTSREETCQKKWASTVDSIIGGLESKYVNLVNQIHLQAPNAKVYLVGYPRFFPTNPPKNCSTGAGPYVFGQSDMLWINSEIKSLDNVLSASAQNSGASYVDMYNMVGADHDLCSPQPWLNRAIPSDKIFSYHPNKSGHVSEANILLAVLQKNS